jgi:hypothetical protein
VFRGALHLVGWSRVAGGPGGVRAWYPKIWRETPDGRWVTVAVTFDTTPDYFEATTGDDDGLVFTGVVGSRPETRKAVAWGSVAGHHFRQTLAVAEKGAVRWAVRHGDRWVVIVFHGFHQYAMYEAPVRCATGEPC